MSNSSASSLRSHTCSSSTVWCFLTAQVPSPFHIFPATYVNHAQVAQDLELSSARRNCDFVSCVDVILGWDVALRLCIFLGGYTE